MRWACIWVIFCCTSVLVAIPYIRMAALCATAACALKVLDLGYQVVNSPFIQTCCELVPHPWQGPWLDMPREMPKDSQALWLKLKKRWRATHDVQEQDVLVKQMLFLKTFPWRLLSEQPFNKVALGQEMQQSFVWAVDQPLDREVVQYFLQDLNLSFAELTPNITLSEWNGSNLGPGWLTKLVHQAQGEPIILVVNFDNIDPQLWPVFSKWLSEQRFFDHYLNTTIAFDMVKVLWLGVAQARNKIFNVVDTAALDLTNFIDKQLVDYVEPEQILQKVVHSFERQVFGFQAIKQQLLQALCYSLCVQKASSEGQKNIWLLSGPPGIGKSFLAQALATSLDRPLVTINLTGVMHAYQIKGWPASYQQAGPGLIAQALLANPGKQVVFLLDEVDKMNFSMDGQGAGYALLELLDSNQNRQFYDNFLGARLDCSQAWFILTANQESSLPQPLLDRCMLFRLSGYSDAEKLIISRDYLLPKINIGLPKACQLVLADEQLQRLILNDCNNPGLRDLERELCGLRDRLCMQHLGICLENNCTLGGGSEQ